MVRIIQVPQGAIALVAPTIWFAAEEKNTFGVCRSADKGGKILWERCQRKLVDEAVAKIIPGMNIGRAKQQAHQDKDDKPA